MHEYGMRLRAAAIRGLMYYQSYECKIAALNLLNLT